MNITPTGRGDNYLTMQTPKPRCLRAITVGKWSIKTFSFSREIFRERSCIDK
jgi:hypothetical protein